MLIAVRPGEVVRMGAEVAVVAARLESVGGGVRSFAGVVVVEKRKTLVSNEILEDRIV